MAWEIIALGLGPRYPNPSHHFTGSLPKEGSNLPTSWATTAEKPPCLAPQRLPVPALCVCHIMCVHACVLVKTGCG